MYMSSGFFNWKRQFLAKSDFIVAKLLQKSCLSFAGPMWGNNTSCEDPVIVCQIIYHRLIHGSLTKASITEPLLRKNGCILDFFLCGLLCHPLQKALSLSSAPLSNFRGTVTKIRPHRRCLGVIFRMALVKGYRFTWGGAFFGQNLLFLIGRDARLQKTL